MGKDETISKINKELKVYINESSFISNKCRNKLLKIFEEEFMVSLDISNYKNVDLMITEDYKIIYREDTYDTNITSLDELIKRYHSFQERADVLIRRRNVDFQGRRNFNNFTNLILILCIILLFIGMFLLGVYAFIAGDYFDCLWFLIVIVPWIVPKLKENLKDRFIQARQYLKSLLKKIK